MFTPKKAACIKLWVDTVGAVSKTNDLIFVHAQIVDEDGTPVYESFLPIEFQIKGNGKIINNKLNKTLGDITSILVKTGDAAGEIVIEVKYSQLEKKNIEFCI